MHYASHRGHAELVKILLEKGINIEAVDEFWWTPLHLAVKALLEKGVNKEAASKFGWTSLDMAAQQGYVEVVKVLLAKGATKRAFDNNGHITPTRLFIRRRHFQVTTYLAGQGNYK